MRDPSLFSSGRVFFSSQNFLSFFSSGRQASLRARSCVFSYLSSIVTILASFLACGSFSLVLGRATSNRAFYFPPLLRDRSSDFVTFRRRGPFFVSGERWRSLEGQEMSCRPLRFFWRLSTALFFSRPVPAEHLYRFMGSDRESVPAGVLASPHAVFSLPSPSPLPAERPPV